jgi:hypothetical protein
MLDRGVIQGRQLAALIGGWVAGDEAALKRERDVALFLVEPCALQRQGRLFRTGQ